MKLWNASGWIHLLLRQRFNWEREVEIVESSVQSPALEVRQLLVEDQVAESEMRLQIAGTGGTDGVTKLQAVYRYA